MTISPTAPATTIDDVLRNGAVRSVFQPIVELDTGRVVAYEALARGPQGPLERPDSLFAAAREAGRLAELDAACRTAALTGALAVGLQAPLTLFVNVEPEVLDRAPMEELLAIAQTAPGGLRVVLEITERALATRPAELLRTVERVRSVGWGVAVDDVGAEAMSLAFMPLLRPDVVKLDLRLVQERPGPAIAEIMNAVNAHAERTGSVVLAEGIEDEAHLATARALGATLGQGWFFGRPDPGPVDGAVHGSLVLPSQLPDTVSEDADVSPFACLPIDVPLREAPKALLIELSKQLEREALRLGAASVVAATFQEARHFTPATTLRYRDLVERTGFVCALGEDLPAEPLPGLRGAALDPADPLRGEWDVTVLGPHFAAALLARDLGDDGPDAQRRFAYALTYDRDTVVRATAALLARVAPPQEPLPSPPRPEPAAPVAGQVDVGVLVSATGDTLVHGALAATPSGVSIVDVRLPDQPLVYVNPAFERLAGLPTSELLGRNCRFLQGPDTDPAAVAAVRRAVDAGEECRVAMLNHRGPERTPWWNELHLAPVTGPDGTVTHYIGTQVDVTARVEAERALVQERDRTRSHLARIEELACTDPLTGLPNRRRLAEQVDTAIWNARVRSEAVALLFVDLVGFKGVNDRFGHAVGDELLVAVAERLRGRLRRNDLLARLGGDEFLVALTGLPEATAGAEAGRIADELAAVVARPVTLRDQEVVVRASTGVSVWPEDGADFPALLHSADMRMYATRMRPTG
ncbi:PAS domain S-box-containing protein/diguanylate cyclase (GGDEF) domain-containing protein [Geodermatophilus obscurus]|uniref:PAS domain S-box-containing protein/diguanylate cyclase (GGDEF) domain-containing protein n=1 Tax=Geodermatophilus obscurus TaxID=1861 RepID=A0A1M7UMX8_9ACTN|nr:diguanylate cyclase [Geodermatophilus obscurus]SHN84383.1 PAS domain S-box-containing protein/diguanylate cyclase (GGDEF) domain-containing protein [Geodermatophilus obscurus]